MDAELDWSDYLSLGEQQRLAFARLLLAHPKYAVLDEATSALDEQHEAALYKLLRQLNTSFVSVGHRSSLIRYHDSVLELKGNSTWTVHSAGDYHEEIIKRPHAAETTAVA
ncbi:MAG TPA: ATP-binding cassette domain-containing protein [Candidatus Obscuribacterales bacterium]